MAHERPRPQGMGIEDFLREAALDDLKDKLELHEYASVSEYAKAVGEQPQLIHYYIRTDRIKKVACKCCGRPVISVEQANEVLANRKKDQ
jgi:hypothetical protein